MIILSSVHSSSNSKLQQWYPSIEAKYIPKILILIFSHLFHKWFTNYIIRIYTQFARIFLDKVSLEIDLLKTIISIILLYKQITRFMDNNFSILLPNINYQKLILVWSIVVIVCLVISIAYMGFYHKIKQKLAKSSIQSISKLPQQTLKKWYQKDKLLTVREVWADFCSSFLLFSAKRDINIHDFVKKMWKKDILSKIYKWNLTLEEENKLKILIEDMNIV